MSIEAMKQALEALELAHPRFGVATETHKQAITSLRQAIEQAEKQEPAVWVRTNGINNSGVAHYGPTCPPGWVAAAKPYYDTPQQRPWVSLTDAEIEEFDYYARDLVMDIEKALKERNT